MKSSSRGWPLGPSVPNFASSPNLAIVRHSEVVPNLATPLVEWRGWRGSKNTANFAVGEVPRRESLIDYLRRLNLTLEEWERINSDIDAEERRNQAERERVRREGGKPRWRLP